MKLFKKCLVVFCMVLMLGSMQVSAAETDTENKSTVTFEELNDESVFIKQSRRGTCTLASAAMVIRRAAMLSGDENWQDITESSVGRSAWTSVGLSWSFSSAGVSMTHARVSSTGELKRLLEDHPEGIVAYDSYKPHAILLTDYDEETDTFYCSDPSEACAYGRMPVSQSLISVSNVDVVWYVSYPTGLAIAEPEVIEEPQEPQVLEIKDIPVTVLDKTETMMNEVETSDIYTAETELETMMNETEADNKK